MSISTLKSVVTSAYDCQKLRVSVGNRIVQAYLQGQGVEPGEKPDEETENILKLLREEFKRVTDGLLVTNRRKFKPTPVLTSFALAIMVEQYEALLRAENRQMGSIEDELETMPIWNEFLSGVRGCGPTMAGVILSRFDIHKAERPSQFWAYAGYDVAADGRGRSRRKEHLVTRTYTDREGNESERQGITFDPFLKTKLYVLATSFIKAGGPYRTVYDGYKLRLESHPNWVEKTKSHRHNAAMRYMIKMFLLDLWTRWREIEKLPIVPSYHEAKLGHKHAA